MKRITKIVADGPQRLRGSREYGALRERLMAEARIRHGNVPAKASIWGRIWIRMAIEREVRAQLEKIHPSKALYLQAGSVMRTHLPAICRSPAAGAEG